MRLVTVFFRPMQTWLAAFFLVIGGLLGGHIAIFWDTSAYVRQGEYWASHWHLAAPLAPPPYTDGWFSLMPATIAERGEGPLAIAASRSAAYGLFLYLVATIGTLKLIVLLQALATAWLLRTTTRMALPEKESLAFWSLIAVLVFGSSLPFFVDFAMPDVFSGLTILATVLLLMGPCASFWVERIALWLLAVFGLIVHVTSVPVVLVIVVVGGVWHAFVGRPSHAILLRAVPLLLGIGIGLLAPRVFDMAYEHETGMVQGSPPFIMARLLADGPGRAYLKTNCPGGASPALCPYKDRPLDDADAILWDRGERGLIASADLATRLQLKKEEMPFARAVLFFDPTGVVIAAMRNGLRQLVTVTVDDPLIDPKAYQTQIHADTPAIDLLLPGLRRCTTTSGCGRPTPSRLANLLHGIHASVALLSIAVLVAISIAGRAGLDPRRFRSLRDGGLLIVLAIVTNAFVCGALSGVFSRYQARIVWLLPMMAVLGLFALVTALQRREPQTKV